MDEVQVEKTNYQMPPVEGFTIAHFLTVADLERSMNFYATVFGGDIVSRGDGNAPPYIRIANTWLILNVGGGPTPDKPTVTLQTPDPNLISSFMNIRVADIQAPAASPRSCPFEGRIGEENSNLVYPCRG